METVTIGCRLPQGIMLEVGQQVVTQIGGKLVTQLRRGENYQRYRLHGTNRTAFAEGGIRIPSRLAPEPYINRDVPKALWDQWVKDHPRSWFLSSGNVFEIAGAKDAANVNAAKVDAMSKPAPFAPLDPSKPMKVGADIVETAKF